MSSTISITKSVALFVLRPVSGFVVGFGAIFFCFVVVGAYDLVEIEFNGVQLAHRQWVRSVCTWTGVGCAFVTSLFGGLRIPRYFLVFTLVFALISILPIIPHKGRGLPLPVATPYVNFGGETITIAQLFVHVAVALFTSYFICRLIRKPDPQPDI